MNRRKMTAGWLIAAVSALVTSFNKQILVDEIFADDQQRRDWRKRWGL